MNNEAIQQIKKNKRLLEERLNTLISEQVGAFARENGVTPRSLTTNIQPIYQMGGDNNPVTVFVYSSVHIEI